MMAGTPKYIYFAGDNLFGTKYYRKAIIVGETINLARRQHLYSPGKGMMTPQAGDIISYTGARGLLWPFMDYFLAPPNVSDKYIHDLFSWMRPFKDIVYPIRDMSALHTKEGFGFWGNLPLEEAVPQLKRLLLEYFESA